MIPFGILMGISETILVVLCRCQIITCTPFASVHVNSYCQLLHLFTYIAGIFIMLDIGELTLKDGIMKISHIR